jgi:dephospho-CoA kinase
MRKRGWSQEELTAREAAQWPLERKRAASHAVIANGSEVSDQQLLVEARRVLQMSAERASH